ncbi:hypothetical protein KY336_04840, partial [Candidatus Woesearchaeota archaeon]|nr:hypothetical protein [Candidatus Woesearchaeota archaeon]
IQYSEEVIALEKELEQARKEFIATIEELNKREELLDEQYKDDEDNPLYAEELGEIKAHMQTAVDAFIPKIDELYEAKAKFISRNAAAQEMTGKYVDAFVASWMPNRYDYTLYNHGAKLVFYAEESGASTGFQPFDFDTTGSLGVSFPNLEALKKSILYASYKDIPVSKNIDEWRGPNYRTVFSDVKEYYNRIETFARNDLIDSVRPSAFEVSPASSVVPRAEKIFVYEDELYPMDKDLLERGVFDSGLDEKTVIKQRPEVVEAVPVEARPVQEFISPEEGVEVPIGVAMGLGFVGSLFFGILSGSYGGWEASLVSASIGMLGTLGYGMYRGFKWLENKLVSGVSRTMGVKRKAQRGETELAVPIFTAVGGFGLYAAIRLAVEMGLSFTEALPVIVGGSSFLIPVLLAVGITKLMQPKQAPKVIEAEVKVPVATRPTEEGVILETRLSDGSYIYSSKDTQYNIRFIEEPVEKSERISKVMQAYDYAMDNVNKPGLYDELKLEFGIVIILDLPKPETREIYEVEILDLIGEGGSANIYKVLIKGKEYALKRAKFGRDSNLLWEIKVLDELSKQNVRNVPMFYGFMDFGDGHYGLVRELIEGKEYDPKDYSEDERRAIYQQLKNTITQLNDMGIYLNDFAKRQVMITEGKEAKIVDFGTTAFESTIISDKEALERDFNPDIGTFRLLWYNIRNLLYSRRSMEKAGELSRKAALEGFIFEPEEAEVTKEEIEEGVTTEPDGSVRVSDELIEETGMDEEVLAEEIEEETPEDDSCSIGGSIHCSGANEESVEKAVEEIIEETKAILDLGPEALESKTRAIPESVQEARDFIKNSGGMLVDPAEGFKRPSTVRFRKTPDEFGERAFTENNFLKLLSDDPYKGFGKLPEGFGDFVVQAQGYIFPEHNLEEIIYQYTRAG